MLTKMQMRERATTLFEKGRELALTQTDAVWTKAPTPQQLVSPNSGYRIGQDESVHVQQLLFAKRGWQYASIRPIATRIAKQTLKAVRKATGRGKTVANWERLRMPDRVKQVRFPELEPLTSHPLFDVVSHPNPFMVQWQLMWATVFSLQATGKAYWWFVQKKGQLQVWPVPASWVRPDNSKGVRGGWLITPDGHTGEPYAVEGNEVAFFYFPDPGDPLASMSSLAAAARPILTDDAIHESQYQGFQAGHMPHHAFIVGERVDPDGQKRRPELSEAQRKELDARLRSLFGGPSKHGRAIVLDNLITDVKQLSMAPEEMAYKDSMKVTEREIEKIFGVNPIMLGEIENANRASATVADSIFLSNVCNPLLELLGQVLTEFIRACPFFVGQQDVIAYFDEIVAADPEMEQKDWQFAADRGMVDIDDYRVHRLGLPPLKSNGDIARINITMIDVPVGKPRPPEAAPTTVVPPAPERSFKAMASKTWKRQHEAYEAKVAAVLEGLFQRQARAFEEQIENGVMDAETIASTENWSESIKAAVKPVLREAAISGASLELELLKAMTVQHTKADELDDRLFGNAGNVLYGVDDYLDNLFKQSYWYDIGDGIEDDLDKLLRRFQSEGMSSANMAREIAEKFDHLSIARAQRIARTETTGALGAGSHFARIELAETGLVTGKEWNSILDEETRGADPKDAFNHVLMDGQRVGVKDDFNVDGEMAPFPGHYSLSAANRVHCLLPGTRVSGFYHAAMRSFYDGEIIEIVLGDGRRLSMTPNHPVLTPCGFVSAGELYCGSKVIAANRQVDTPTNRVPSGRNHKHNVPPTIQDVFQSFMLRYGKAGSVELASATEDDFHGDGKFIHGQVDIVRSNRSLVRYRESALPQERSSFSFHPVDAQSALLDTSRNQFKTLSAVDAACASIPCRLTLPLNQSSVGLYSGPLQQLGVTPASRDYTGVGKKRRDQSSGHATLVCQTLDGTSAVVPLNDIRTTESFLPGVSGHLLVSLAACSTDTKIGEQEFLDTKHANAEFLTDLASSGSSVVQANDVVSVERVKWSGHVYDLSSSSGLVFANGIVTSNCRCYTSSVLLID